MQSEKRRNISRFARAHWHWRDSSMLARGAPDREASLSPRNFENESGRYFSVCPSQKSTTKSWGACRCHRRRPRDFVFEARDACGDDTSMRLAPRTQELHERLLGLVTTDASMRGRAVARARRPRRREWPDLNNVYHSPRAVPLPLLAPINVDGICCIRCNLHCCLYLYVICVVTNKCTNV